MATKKKLLQAAAGNAGGGAGLDVEEVFSTFLYSGNGSTRTITNGIDLDGEGGLVWIKNRGNTTTHNLHDTERGAGTYLQTNASSAEVTDNDEVTAFNSNGFSLGDGTKSNSLDGSDYASWTFRKAPKFFDVVDNITMPSSGSVVVNHNLGSRPGMILLKSTDISNQWYVWHRSVFPSYGKYLVLNSTNTVQSSTDVFKSVGETSFSTRTNSAGNYVAYLFAHNDGDGEFGPDGDADIIKCGSFTTDGTGDVAEINLGFEPQWIMLKKTSGTGDWRIGDVMRGDTVDNTFKVLEANTSDAEGTLVISRPTATGYKIDTGFGTNATGIYIAIRRGTAVPESATEVFDISYATDANDAAFPVDFMLSKIMAGGNGYARDRLRGGTKYLLTDTTNADLSGTDIEFDDMTGTGLTGWGTSFIHYNWKRASNYMDCVAYTGDGTTARAISHNLAVPPQLMIHKRRNATNDWYVPDFINSKLLLLNANAAAYDTSILANYYGSGNGSSGGASSVVIPDASTFTVTPNINVNGSGDTYVVYLFATLDGISKVGSYTGNGSFQTIDCGFSAGSRFVLIKRTDATGDWYVWDADRGITQAADPYLELNTTAAETTGNKNYLYPASSGFGVQEINGTNNPNINVSSATYIFYAIA
jgi:hypothetical protein